MILIHRTAARFSEENIAVVLIVLVDHQHAILKMHNSHYML